jgi:hypothetical protein
VRKAWGKVVETVVRGMLSSWDGRAYEMMVHEAVKLLYGCR